MKIYPRTASFVNKSILLSITQVSKNKSCTHIFRPRMYTSDLFYIIIYHDLRVLKIELVFSFFPTQTIRHFMLNILFYGTYTNLIYTNIYV